MGGGRYDGLVEEMGGPPTPAVGLAAGVERLAMLLDGPPPMPAPVAVVPIGEAAEAAALGILQALRAAGMRAEMAYRGNLRRRMERANRIGARAAVILGDDDLAQGVAQVKNLATGEQEAVPLAEYRGKAGMRAGGQPVQDVAVMAMTTRTPPSLVGGVRGEGCDLRRSRPYAPLPRPPPSGGGGVLSRAFRTA